MALRVVEQAGLSDVGRQRDANEDNFVIAEPLFAVADGMGGAQAGEVASRTAADVFEHVDGRRRPPEQLLTEPHARGQPADLRAVAQPTPRGAAWAPRSPPRWCGARASASATSATAAPTGCATAQLEQLTHDHSLVAELQRSGQLTAEAAENHPQRSIITRALGPEPDVEVDAHTHTARAGDVYLLCSDGLTGMISDADMEGDPARRRHARRGRAGAGQGRQPERRQGQHHRGAVPPGRGRRAAAASAGGRRHPVGLGDDPPGADRGRRPDRGARAGARGGQGAGHRRRARRRRKGLPTHARRSRGRARRDRGASACWWSRWWRVGAYLGVRRVYFLGTDDAGLVTIYRGVPYELPLGLDLYSEQYASQRARALAGARRAASACSTTSGAAAPTPRTWCASSRRGTPATRAAADQ